MKYVFQLFARTSLVALLLSGCSHSTPDSAHTNGNTQDNAILAKPAYGVKVDSLDGIPGHHFGEPLSAFPGLVAGQVNGDGMRLYYYPSDGPTLDRGWFGKHRKELMLRYYFENGKFAYFTATAFGDYRKMLNDEAVYLFGIGERFQLTGTIWQGQRTRAMYTTPFLPQGQASHLEIVSEYLEAQQKQRAAVRLKVENDVR